MTVNLLSHPGRGCFKNLTAVQMLLFLLHTDQNIRPHNSEENSLNVDNGDTNLA